MTKRDDAGPGSALFPGIPGRVHLLGAGGAGVSGTARLLLARGHAVSGYDRADSRFVQGLAGLGVRVSLGESRAELLPGDALLVARSAAIGDEDPQVRRARERGLPVLKYSELLGRLAPPRRTLAVAGTHGKTTTSWMLHWALRGLAEAGTKGAGDAPGAPGAPGPGAPGAPGPGAPGAPGPGAPGALVGGTCRTLGTNAVPPGQGGWFACEACEYDRSFLQLEPEGAIVTNVEADHLDCYGSLAAIEEAFARFCDRVHPEGLVAVGRDVPESIEAAAPCPVWRLGREIEVDLLGENHGYFRFRLRGPGFATGEVARGVPGAFNVENAALALALAIGLCARAEGVEPGRAIEAASRGVHRYRGAERRFEPWGTHGGVEVVHDYAHHPTEVRATIEAARRVMPGKPLHVLFQPHQHSRTARFLDEFVESLRGADRVVVADVYGARAHIDGAGRERFAGAEELVLRLARAGVDAVLGGSGPASARKLAERLPGGGAALILGAGDIDLAQHDLLDELALRGARAREPRR